MSAATAPVARLAWPALSGVMAKADRENFPVALRLLPARTRAHLLSIYGFARLVDDAGDEADGDRLALLDEIERALDAVYAGTRTHPSLAPLATTVRACALPREPFARLIQANRRDQFVRRYATYDELLDYCVLSAQPVGRLVLGVFGAATRERIALADRVCTGLQIVEHCQDVVEDLRRDHVYLPSADLERFGCREDDLRRAPAPATVRALVAFEIRRVRELLDAGTPLIRSLRGWARVAVVGYVAGGSAAADAIARADYDVSAGPPRARRRDRLRATAAAWSSTLGRRDR